MTTRYRFPSQLDYEITSVDQANDWLLMQKAGESKQGKVHPVTLIGDMTEQTNGYKFYTPGVSASSPVYSFQFDADTGIGSSAADTINFISGGVSVAKLSATGGLSPTANNTYDLGTATYAWKGAYLQQFLAFDSTNTLIGNSSGQIYFQTGNTPRCGISTDGHFVPSTNNSYDIGSAVSAWRGAYLQQFLAFDSTNTLIGNSSGQIYFQTGNTPRCGISTAGHFLPSTSSNYDLGSSTYRWRDGHFSGTVAAGTVRPQTNNTYDLGSSTYRWRDIYLQTSLVFSTTSTLIGISNGGIYFQTGTTARGGWDSSGNLVPAVNSTSSSTGYYCGISNYKWRAVYAYNGTIQTSDIRDKAGVEDSDLGLDFILALTPRSYRWKDLPGEEETAPASSWIAPLDLGGSTKTQEKSDGLAEPLEEPGGEASGTAESPKEDGGLLEPQSSQPSAPTTPRHKTLDDGRHYGLVAQEVRDALQGKDFAGYIHEEESDGYFLNYAEFISPLIKAVQELAAKVAALESQLADTKAP